MELTLPPRIPITRVVNGHNVFNKGYVHPMRGKTYEEYYGEDAARRIKKTKSEHLKGHPFWGNRNGHSNPCVAIFDGRIMGRFESAKQASEVMGVCYSTLRRYIKGLIKPENGWQWFYEAESYKWYGLVTKTK